MTDQAGRCADAQNPWQREALGGYVLNALHPTESANVTARTVRNTFSRSSQINGCAIPGPPRYQSSQLASVVK